MASGRYFGLVHGSIAPSVKRQGLVRNHQVQVEVDGVAEALAAGTRSKGIVKREQPRLRFVVANVAVLALKALREAQLLCRFAVARRRLKQHFSRLAITLLNGIHNPQPRLGRDRDAVDQHQHRLVEVQVQQRLRRGKLEHLSVLVQPVVAPRPQFEEAFPQERIHHRWLGRFLLGALGCFLCRLAALRLLRLGRLRRRLQREERLYPRPFAQPKNALRHLIDGVLLHLLPAVQAVSAAHARVQQPQIIVDFRCGCHRRARIARGVLLLDGDRRSDAVNLINVGLLNALQKLPRVSRKRLYIAPLPLGIDRIEGERRLPRSRHPRHHRQLVVRNLEVDVLQVVDACSAYRDAFVRHGPGLWQRCGQAKPLARLQIG